MSTRENPFNFLSANHRPIGAGAQVGIPAGYNVSTKALQTAAVPNSRGRLSIVGEYTAGRQGPRLRKANLTNALSTPGSVRTISPEAGSPGQNVPVTMRLPSGTGLELYVNTTTDSNPGVFDAANSSNKGAGRYHLFYRFRDDLSTARILRTYPLSGVDYAESDGFDYGTSASRIRWPSCTLQDFEIMPENPAPIRHPLNVASTNFRRPGNIHVMGKTMVWPAFGRDGYSSAAENALGDIPHGTLGFVTAQSHATMLSQFSWTPRQRVILDLHRYYGVYFLDGSSGEVTINGVSKGLMQLRMSLGITFAVENEINVALARILPHLVLLMNPRNYATESEIWTDNLPYRGGGGPIDANSVNNAYDAGSPPPPPPPSEAAMPTLLNVAAFGLEETPVDVPSDPKYVPLVITGTPVLPGDD